MKLLLLLGSPRRAGNSEQLASMVTEAIGDRAEIYAIRINDLSMRPCQGCGGCEQSGECVLTDDMTPLYDILEESQRILLVSPIYFYGVTAQTKMFMDRCQALWVRRYRLQSRAHREFGKRGFFLSTAATHGEKLFSCAQYSARYFFDALGASYKDSLCIRGVDEVGTLQESHREAANSFAELVMKE